MIDADVDEMARIVLMDHPNATFMQFTKELREAAGGTLGLLEIRDVWGRYRSWYGAFATHDVETGLPFGCAP